MKCTCGKDGTEGKIGDQMIVACESCYDHICRVALARGTEVALQCHRAQTLAAYVQLPMFPVAATLPQLGKKPRGARTRKNRTSSDTRSFLQLSFFEGEASNVRTY